MFPPARSAGGALEHWNIFRRTAEFAFRGGRRGRVLVEKATNHRVSLPVLSDDAFQAGFGSRVTMKTVIWRGKLGQISPGRGCDGFITREFSETSP